MSFVNMARKNILTLSMRNSNTDSLKNQAIDLKTVTSLNNFKRFEDDFDSSKTIENLPICHSLTLKTDNSLWHQFLQISRQYLSL